MQTDLIIRSTHGTTATVSVPRDGSLGSQFDGESWLVEADPQHDGRVLVEMPIDEALEAVDAVDVRACRGCACMPDVCACCVECGAPPTWTGSMWVAGCDCHQEVAA